MSAAAASILCALLSLPLAHEVLCFSRGLCAKPFYTASEKTNSLGENSVPKQANYRGFDKGDFTDGDRWLDNYIPYLLYRTSHRLTSRVRRRMQALRIGTSEWRVLSILRAFGAVSIGEIAEGALLEQPTISRVVAKLELSGFVIRESAPHDSRITIVTLTPAGAALFAHLVEPALDHQRQALDGLSSAEIEQFKSVLEHIARNLDRLE